VERRCRRRGRYVVQSLSPLLLLLLRFDAAPLLKHLALALTCCYLTYLGPTDAQFASLWTILAKKYAGESRVIYGIMNEPHDGPSVSN
jgi:hypothetical protein